MSTDPINDEYSNGYQSVSYRTNNEKIQSPISKSFLKKHSSGLIILLISIFSSSGIFITWESQYNCTIWFLISIITATIIYFSMTGLPKGRVLPRRPKIHAISFFISTIIIIIISAILPKTLAALLLLLYIWSMAICINIIIYAFTSKKNKQTQTEYMEQRSE
ncbi:MAG: hypothetical protein H0V70_05005 [Ktedonobacteraceae bacterium]|nr:hypothetical protein [Ktedonobacteraceae bacterium]